MTGTTDEDGDFPPFEGVTDINEMGNGKGIDSVYGGATGSEIVCDCARSPVFTIDRRGLFTLSHQIASLMRQGIVDRRWRPGEKMPSARHLAANFGVSVPTAVEALRILSRDGFVTLRERSRAVVNSEDTVLKNHRVVLVLPRGTQAFMMSVLCERLMLRLEAAGYYVSLVPVPIVGESDGYDISRIKLALQRPCELAICMYTHNWIVDILAATGYPIALVLDSKECENRVGCIRQTFERAYGRFVKLCIRRGVRSVIQVSKWRGDGDGMVEMLREAGMSASEWVVRTSARTAKFRGEGLEMAAFSAFARRLARDGKSWLPDVLFFTDDHTCYGAMTALIGADVRIPEDVRIVTVATRGTRRAYATTLARIEYDPVRMGDITADAVLAYLSTGTFPEHVEIGPKFCVGGSFH